MILLNQDIVMKELVALLLLAIRVGALFSVAPILSATAVTLPIRIALTFAITLAIVGTIKVPEIDLLSPTGVLVIAREALLGLAIGLIFQLAFAAITAAGEQIAGAMGLGFAAMVDRQSRQPGFFCSIAHRSACFVSRLSDEYDYRFYDPRCSTDEYFFNRLHHHHFHGLCSPAGLVAHDRKWHD